MGLLQLLVLCILATCCGAVSPPREILKPAPLVSRGCKDSDVLSVAGLALQDINKQQKDGYVLALNRVKDVWEQRQAISRRKVYNMCPDCPSPVPIDLSDPRVLEAATESLAKYNNESTSKQYSLVKITRGSSQWVFGPSYFVEYLIKESPCTRSQASSCTLQSSDSAPVGLCEGSLAQRASEKYVSVTCDLFPPQVQSPGGDNVEEPPKRNAVSSEASYKTAPTSIQYLPDLDDEKPEDPQSTGLQDAFPVQLDLTTNPQGDILDVSFLFLEPEEKKLVVLPFPKEKQHSDECPGPARKNSPLLLPP
ncbi:fetuin-B isoform X3 [Callospermophilus lateralis]|uniref:fetuin-B isoform X3 n=1 Tax=Callospermophilus lateralis TaxID=76772 RepID=UPI0040538525